MVAVATSFQYDTAFGPATVMVTGAASSLPPQPLTRATVNAMDAAATATINGSLCTRLVFIEDSLDPAPTHNAPTKGRAPS